MYQVTWQHQRPVPAALFAIYALPQGIPVAPIRLGGIGQPWNEPPYPGCVPVFISSDSKGKFGHQCPRCDGYWRADGGVRVCPYCCARGAGHEFLTAAQIAYVQQYCARLTAALNDDQDGDHLIDMDAVADALGKDGDKPPFYYAEEGQQNQFTCNECECFNDILGTYGYCSRCGTRNDFQELEKTTIPRLRARINAGGPYEQCVKDAVSGFDSFAGHYMRQLVDKVPLTPARRARVEKIRFHNLKGVAAEFKSIFDIDILADMKTADVEFAALMFHRRHVYEHNGGEADEKYIADSGDASVRPKQALHETQESAHRIASLVTKMAANLHKGFHEIFPPEQGPIDWYAKRKQAMAAQAQSG